MRSPEHTLIPLKWVGRHIRARNPPHVKTVMRWAFRGVGDPPVKLGTVKIGGRRYTTQAAIDEFIAATSNQSHPGAMAVCDRGRAAAVQQAEHELDADGVC